MSCMKPDKNELTLVGIAFLVSLLTFSLSI